MSNLKPMFLIKPKSISAADIKRAERYCGIVMVECESPDDTRFLDVPMGATLDAQAHAALSLMRRVMAHTDTTFNRATLTKWFTESIMNNRPPEPVKPVKKG